MSAGNTQWPEEGFRDEYREIAEMEYEGRSQDYLYRELRRLNRGPTFWDRIRSGFRAVFNAVKIAASSLLLGRAATARRVSEDTRAMEEKQAQDQAMKAARIEVLNEKLRGMEQEQDREIEQDGEPGQDKEQEAKDGQEKEEEKDPEQDQEQDKEPEGKDGQVQEEAPEEKEQEPDQEQEQEPDKEQDQEQDRVGADSGNGPSRDELKELTAKCIMFCGAAAQDAKLPKWNELPEAQKEACLHGAEILLSVTDGRVRAPEDGFRKIPLKHVTRDVDGVSTRFFMPYAEKLPPELREAAERMANMSAEKIYDGMSGAGEFSKLTETDKTRFTEKITPAFLGMALAGVSFEVPERGKEEKETAEKAPDGKEQEEKTQEGKEREEKGQEGKTPEEKAPEGKEQEEKAPETDREKTGAPSKTPEGNTIFDRQLENMTARFRDGLVKHLEMCTGIDRQYIHAENVDSRIRITFTPAFLKEEGYARGVTIGKDRNPLEQGRVADLITKETLYYTSKVYCRSAEKVRERGTVPSERDCRDAMRLLRKESAEMEQRGAKNVIAASKLYGHSVGYRVSDGRGAFYLDGKPVTAKNERDLPAALKQMASDAIRGENGDYARINEVSRELHAFAKEEITPGCRAKYKGEEVREIFTGAFRDMVREKSPAVQSMDFHGMDVRVSIDKEKGAIGEVAINGEKVFDGRRDGYLEPGDVAKCIENDIRGGLVERGMYEFDKDIAHITSGPVSEIDRNGRVTDDTLPISRDDDRFPLEVIGELNEQLR